MTKKKTSEQRKPKDATRIPSKEREPSLVIDITLDLNTCHFDATCCSEKLPCRLTSFGHPKVYDILNIIQVGDRVQWLRRTGRSGTAEIERRGRRNGG